MKETNYGILITTRNRISNLCKLVDSITKLIEKPELIVISYSGENPYEKIKKFENLLRIVYVESSKPGQVLQKKVGLKYFEQNVDWIMFCDDDFVLEPNCISIMFEVIFQQKNFTAIGGAGFSLGNQTRNRQSIFEKYVRYIFNMNILPPGIVRSNGYNTDYIYESSITQTTWLNGASIWRREIAKSYDVQLEDVTHALGEDLIFSYRVSRNNILIFNPYSFIYIQDNPESQISDSQLRFEQLYHGLYFVLLFKDLSKLGYLWVCFGKIMKSLILRTKKDIGFRSEITDFIDVFKIIVTNKSPRYVLDYRIRNVSK
jgi:GT2 family glycosyltransferase